MADTVLLRVERKLFDEITEIQYVNRMRSKGDAVKFLFDSYASTIDSLDNFINAFNHVRDQSKNILSPRQEYIMNNLNAVLRATEVKQVVILEGMVNQLKKEVVMPGEEPRNENDLTDPEENLLSP